MMLPQPKFILKKKTRRTTLAVLFPPPLVSRLSLLEFGRDFEAADGDDDDRDDQIHF